MSMNRNTKFGVSLFFIISFLYLCPQAVCADFYVIPTATGKIKPSQMVELYTEFYVGPNSTENVHQKTYNGADAGVFTVPTGMVLIINTVVIHPSVFENGVGWIEIRQNGVTRTRITVDFSRHDSFRQFWPGLVIGPESTLSVRNVPVSHSSVYVRFYGYVTSDR